MADSGSIWLEGKKKRQFFLAPFLFCDRTHFPSKCGRPLPKMVSASLPAPSLSSRWELLGPHYESRFHSLQCFPLMLVNTNKHTIPHLNSSVTDGVPHFDANPSGYDYATHLEASIEKKAN